MNKVTIGVIGTGDKSKVGKVIPNSNVTVVCEKPNNKFLCIIATTTNMSRRDYFNHIIKLFKETTSVQLTNPFILEYIDD